MAKGAKYFIGLPQWQHDQWDGGPLAGSGGALRRYARHFNSVEGNTTFYGLPRSETIARWAAETPDNFRFCFKFRQEISHRSALVTSHPLVLEQLDRLAPLQAKIGLLCLQLPKSFGAEGLPELEHFLASLPSEYRYSVEVRNLEFFAKGDAERELNQLLIRQGVNRVMFDTRPLFAEIAADAATLDAQRKKPKVPLHVLATGQHPQLRFIAPIQYERAEKYLDQWVGKVANWLDQGLEPFLFFHTPDNCQAPELARWFVAKLEAIRPAARGFTPWVETGQQDGLF